jgi:hypothetical protein
LKYLTEESTNMKRILYSYFSFLKVSFAYSILCSTKDVEIFRPFRPLHYTVSYWTNLNVKEIADRLIPCTYHPREVFSVGATDIIGVREEENKEKRKNGGPRTEDRIREVGLSEHQDVEIRGWPHLVVRGPAAEIATALRASQ